VKLKELLQKNYISTNNHWKESYVKFSQRDDLWDWVPLDKISIKKIKIDKSLLLIDLKVNKNA
jgi:hypothetical protein